VADAASVDTTKVFVLCNSTIEIHNRKVSVYPSQDVLALGIKSKRNY
jgi:hypothetical protein